MHETTPVSAVQNLYNMLEWDCEKDVLPYCAEHGIGVVPFSPIASGFLSGKVTAYIKFEGDDVRKFVPQLQKDNLFANQPVLDILNQYAAENEATNAQVSLVWMLKKYPNIVPLVLWIPCMLAAVGCMYLFLYCCCKITMQQALYICAAAFVIAEFGASLEWNLFVYLDQAGIGFTIVRNLVLVLTCGLIFMITFRLESGLLKKELLNHLSKWELISTVVLVIVTFAFSNISFLISDASENLSACLNILKMRTLVDFSGLAVLYAFQSRVSEYLSEKEAEAIRIMLKSQYDQYRSYQESMELIRIQRHDLKHHIAVLRAETDRKKREEWLELLEEDLNQNEMAAPTGNRVLDIMLTAKQGVIKKNDIHFTWVADGALLDFIHVTDICTIIGNAMDNAIESVAVLDNRE